MDLATAFSSLQGKNSYQMTIDLQNVPGALSMMAAISPSPTITVEASGGNKHVVVSNDTGGKLAELWYVNGSAWVSVSGSTPTQLSGSAANAALLPLATADQQMIQTLSAPGANWQVSGTETVNGVPTQVETATYQINPSANAFLGSGPYTVNGKLWVAQTGGYLVQAQMQLGQGAATPTAGGSAVSIKVSKIGEPITINAPGS